MIKHFRHEFEAKIVRPNLPTSDGKEIIPAGARG
jgi:NADH-quinone oxidoreductase subunit F